MRRVLATLFIKMVNVRHVVQEYMVVHLVEIVSVLNVFQGSFFQLTVLVLNVLLLFQIVLCVVDLSNVLIAFHLILLNLVLVNVLCTRLLHLMKEDPKNARKANI